MTHPLVDQLRFTRSEFMRSVKGVTDMDARKRFPPLNCISWNIGHLAWQEQTRFLFYGQGRVLLPEINELCGKGNPASTPPLKEMLDAWKAITQTNDAWLDSLDSAKLRENVVQEGVVTSSTWGSVLLRVTYHYWYHLGENSSIRQKLGHKRLPVFVGRIDTLAPWRPE